MCFVYLYQALCLVMTLLIVAGDSSGHHQNIRIGEDMELHLYHAARGLSDVLLSFNEKAIAEANDVVSMKWDLGLSETYTGRLFLTNPENLTITLHNLTTEDAGMYSADVTTEKGIFWTIRRIIYVSDCNCQNRKKRSSDQGFCGAGCATQSESGKPCPCPDIKRDGTDPGTEPGTDPINPLPIVLGVLVPIIAIAVITIIIVIYKRRSRTPREQEPPGSDNLVPMNDYKE